LHSLKKSKEIAESDAMLARPHPRLTRQDPDQRRVARRVRVALTRGCEDALKAIHGDEGGRKIAEEELEKRRHRVDVAR
jgi:hypothetical protein